ncbi:MAG TPA: hypothetical protein VM286_07915 [Candidatus Thermoplasmatota archaeon]|nr:hypothetical protein [Candidatus Thermoplasmatota archaeon]
MPRLNPAQHRLWMRHVERAAETLHEADRLLKGAVTDVVARLVKVLRDEATLVDQEASTAVRFSIADLPLRLVPYLEDPFAQGLAFNLHCERTHQSHTQAAKGWEGGAAAVSARNLMFLPLVYHDLWHEGVLEKTRLVAIANRNLTEKAYLEVAALVRSRRKEDVDERLLKLPAGSMQLGRRGPVEAIEAAKRNGWLERLGRVDIPAELVGEAARGLPDEPAAGAPGALGGEDTDAGADGDAGSAPAQAAPPRDLPPGEVALRTLRAGLSGARIAPEVLEALQVSPDPAVLVDRYLIAHRKSGAPDPIEVTKTLFFAHAGPMQKLTADDKLLLRHFRPVKTQKRGQLFYRLLEVIEERLTEKSRDPDLDARGLDEREAMAAVRKVIVELNKDPNRYLLVTDEWLGEVTRRHLYFGSRTRKEGAAYKWYRKIGPIFYLGAHKTKEELEEKQARRAAKLADAEEDGDDEDE